MLIKYTNDKNREQLKKKNVLEPERASERMSECENQAQPQDRGSDSGSKA